MIKKSERVCYSCGDPIPDRTKSDGGFISALLIVGLVLALAFTAWSFFGGPIQKAISPSAPPAHRVSAALTSRRV